MYVFPTCYFNIWCWKLIDLTRSEVISLTVFSSKLHREPDRE
jgi:hypothetical protein